MYLSDIELNKNYVVKSINIKGKEKKRLYDLGLFPDVSIKKVLTSLLGEPCAYEIKGTTIAIRSDISSLIEVSCE